MTKAGTPQRRSCVKTQAVTAELRKSEFLRAARRHRIEFAANASIARDILRMSAQLAIQ
jgi:hypothetical protein